MELIILSQLFKNKKYIKMVLPFIKPSYFDDEYDRKIFAECFKFVKKFKKVPTFSAIINEFQKSDKLSSSGFEGLMERLEEIKGESEDHDFDWLMEETEIFCKGKAFDNAVIKCSELVGDAKKDKTSSIQIMKDALKVSFNRTIGIELNDEQTALDLFEYLRDGASKFPTLLKKIDAVTNGGFESKALSIFVGAPHSGKSMSLCNIAANFSKQGYNVLYITLEMSKEKISNILYSNFLDMDNNDFRHTKKETIIDEFKKSDLSTVGKIIIEEFPTGTASSLDIERLLDDLEYKREFRPDAIIIDYLNLMKADLPPGTKDYALVKQICSDVRSIACDDYCIVSATQFNRTGAESTDPTMEQIADSYALNAIADFVMAVYNSDEIDDESILFNKVLKNRFGGIVNYKFVTKKEFPRGRLKNASSEYDSFSKTDNSESGASAVSLQEQREKLKKLRSKDKRKRSSKRVNKGKKKSPKKINNEQPSNKDIDELFD